MVARLSVIVASAALFMTAGCGANGAISNVSPPRAPDVRPATGHPVSQYISHVIVIVQENRSFENFFAGFPGANAPMYGCASSGSGLPALRMHKGSSSLCPPSDTEVPLHPITFVGPDLRHDWYSSMASWDNGKMDGFWKFGGHSSGADAAYAYVNPDLIAPYLYLANNYVLADEMFPTEFGGSFTAHLTLVAGTDNISNRPLRAEVDFPDVPPDDCDSPPGTTSAFITKDRKKHHTGPFPCFNQFNTLAEVMDKAKVSWKYYVTKHVGAGLWSAFEAIKYVRYGRDWHRNVISPQTKILTDPGSNNLASVSWVTPSKPDSDHPGDHSDLGPSWVANVINAIGESPYWNTSAIILLWDDWGGWYDNASPQQLDFRGLGIRVPCLIISPYSRETSASHPGYVSHTQYEFGSILRFIEEVYNLPYIGPEDKGYTDERAATLDDSFDFTQSPRPFVPIQTKYPMSRFLHEPPSNEPVDTE
jgi:phospholipase C